MNNTAAYALIAVAFFVDALPAGKPERIVLKPVRNTYAVAESFSCMEVERVCRMRKRLERVQR